jgi:hypothetical protein
MRYSSFDAWQRIEDPSVVLFDRFMMEERIWLESVKTVPDAHAIIRTLKICIVYARRVKIL